MKLSIATTLSSNTEAVRLSELVGLPLVSQNNSYASREYVFDASTFQKMAQLTAFAQMTHTVLTKEFHARFLSGFVTRSSKKTLYVVLLQTGLKSV